jgi:hypothetical protein
MYGGAMCGSAAYGVIHGYPFATDTQFATRSINGIFCWRQKKQGVYLYTPPIGQPFTLLLSTSL